MKCKELKLKGAYLIDLDPQQDERGFFARTFCRKEFPSFEIVQSNLSFNNLSGTIRGMHYQEEPKAEAKLVSCSKGAIYDIIIDLRKESPTFTHAIAVTLSQANRQQLYIPKGFAHGFQTLEDNCEVIYQMSEYYDPSHATGLRWNDPAFQITWPLPITLISPKDSNWPDFIP